MAIMVDIEQGGLDDYVVDPSMAKFSSNIWTSQEPKENTSQEGIIHTTIYSMTTRLVNLNIITVEQAVEVEAGSIGRFEHRVELLRALEVVVWFPDPLEGAISETTRVILKWLPQPHSPLKAIKQGVKSIW